MIKDWLANGVYLVSVIGLALRDRLQGAAVTMVTMVMSVAAIMDLVTLSIMWGTALEAEVDSTMALRMIGEKGKVFFSISSHFLSQPVNAVCTSFVIGSFFH